MSRNESLRILVTTLFQTIPVLKSLIYVSGLMMWILAINLTDWWMGKLQYCSIENGVIVKNKNECLEK